MYPSYFNETFRRESLHRAGDKTSIMIDDPEITMRHEMIDFDVVEQAKEVEKWARRRQEGRKPFFCLLSGRGTGKTRTLCELHSELLKEEYNCLSLAITFDHRWAARSFLKEGSSSEQITARTQIALEIISRLASVLYGEEHKDIVSKFKARGVMSKLKSAFSDDLFKAFLEHAVARVRQTGRRVDYVVLHIDECAQMMKGIYGNAFACIRNDILLHDFEDNFTAGLVIASDKGGPLRLSYSNRSIFSIKKPTKLSMSPLLKDWFGMENTIFSRLFLTLLHRLPRTVQILQTDVLKRLEPATYITAENFRPLFSDLATATARDYKEVCFPSDDVFAKVVFREEVLLTKEVEGLIVNSVFTNNVHWSFVDETTLYPEANAFMMYVSLMKVLESERKPMERQFMKAMDTTIDLLAGINANDGRVILDNFFLQQLSLRLHCACHKGSKVSLAELLGMKYMNLFHVPCKSIMEASIPQFDYCYLSDTMNATIPSLNAKNKVAFKAFIASIPETLTVGLWKAAEGDSYDFLLMVRRPDDLENAFFLFIEQKSTHTKTGPVVATLDGVRQCLDDYRDFNATRDSLVDVIKPENYLYSYFLPDDEVKTRYDRARGCLIIGGAESSRFFSFFDEFYRTLRDLVNDPNFIRTKQL